MRVELSSGWPVFTDNPVVSSSVEDAPSPDLPGGTYRLFRGWRPLMFVMSFYFIAAAVLLVVQSARASVPWTFTIVWLCAYGWVVPQVLLRLAFLVEVRGGFVSWEAAARSGRFAASDLRALRPYRWGRNMEILELRTGQKIFVMIARGFREFAADLQQNAPVARIEVGALTKVAERWPGSKNYYERDH